MSTAMWLWMQDFIDAEIAFQRARQTLRKHMKPAIIREWRESKGLTVRKMAAELKVSPSYYSKVERGIELPSAQLIGRIYDMG